MYEKTWNLQIGWTSQVIILLFVICCMRKHGIYKLVEHHRLINYYLLNVTVLYEKYGIYKLVEHKWLNYVYLQFIDICINNYTFWIDILLINCFKITYYFLYLYRLLMVTVI